MVDAQQVKEIVAQFEELFQSKNSISPVLDRIMDVLGGRAIGLWRCKAGKLIQVGFRAVTEMDEQVRKQFASFTQEVSLENTGLGIVKAVMERTPAIGTLRGEETGLQGSSEWLQKFGAQQSYAIPVVEGDEVVGVLAISTNCVHQAGDPEWEILTKIADGIGEKKLLGMF